MNSQERLIELYSKRYAIQHSGVLPPNDINTLIEEQDTRPEKIPNKLQRKIRANLEEARQELKRILGYEPEARFICARYLEATVELQARKDMEGSSRSGNALEFAYHWDRCMAITRVIGAIVDTRQPHKGDHDILNAVRYMQEVVPEVPKPALPDQAEMYLQSIREEEMADEWYKQDPSCITLLDNLLKRTVEDWVDNTYIKEAVVFAMQETIKLYKGIYPIAVQVSNATNYS